MATKRLYIFLWVPVSLFLTIYVNNGYSWAFSGARLEPRRPRTQSGPTKNFLRLYSGHPITRIQVSSCPIMDKNAIYNSTNEQVPLSAEKVAEVPKTLSRLSGLRFLLSSLRGNPHKLLEKLYRKHGENFIIPPNIVIINDPKAIRDVLEVHNLPKTPKVRFGYKSIFYGGNARSSGGILAAPWQKWIEQRRMTAPALAEKAIGSLAVKFHNASLPFFAYIDSMVAENRPIDMSEAFTAVTMDIIGKILLGKTFGMCESLQTTTKDKNVPFASALHVLTDEAVRQMVLPGWWLRWRPKAEKVEAARAVIDDFLEECIRARLSQTEADGNKRQLLEQNTTDLLDILVAAEADGVISRKEVKGQLLTFVFAGFDTLAPTLTYMLWEISQNFELQEKLAAEARSLLPDEEAFPNTHISDLVEMLPTMDQTFSETNRKHPAAAMGTSRQVGRQDIVVGDGILLPAKSIVLIPSWTLHRNERFWPDPEQFDPSRFDKSKNVGEPFSYQPFSGGPRNCVGAKLARAETLSLFAPLLRRYVITCKSKKVPADHYSLTRKPRKRVFFSLRKRSE